MPEIDPTCAIEPPCTVTPASLYGGQPESNFTVTVTPDPATAAWSASSPVPWVQFPDCAFPLTGSHTVIVRIVRNDADGFRETTITFGTTPVIVKQEGVELAPTPPEPEPAPNPGDLYPNACHDRDPREKPTLPTLGPAGYTFTDPAFGTRLIRATDETTGAGAAWRVPSNAHLAAWNADASKFVLVSNAGTKVFAWDGTTPRPIADVRTQCEPCWSRRDPAVLYGVGGPQVRTLQAFVFDGDTIAHTVDLLDLDTLGLGLDTPQTYVGGLVTSDDAITIFFGGEGQDRHGYAAQLPIGADAVTWILDTRTLGFLLHSAAVDLSGQYVALYPTGATPAQTVIVDVVNNAAAPVTVSPGGHDALGYGYQVNADSGEQEWDAAQWQIRPLHALAQRADLITPVLRPKEVYLSEHSTWNNARPDTLAPVLSATFRFNNEACAWRAWDDEVIAIATTGPSDVARFCHHRSDSRDEANSAGTYFWYQPIANVSADGRWLLFTSNWEKTLGADPTDAGRSRQDVFIVDLEGTV